jgi:large subunit ribosomal protein L32e
MLPTKELLELRKQIKTRKPDFVRQDFHKKKRLGKKWRRPRGLHSKIRLDFKGRGKNVSVGYRSPKKIRGLHKSGLWQCLISSGSDLEGLDPKTSCIIISSSMGNRKRVDVLKQARERGFNVLNIKNPDEYIKKIEDMMISKKKAKAEKKKKKKDAKTVEKKEKLAEKLGEEEKKKIEKREKDKILTRKDK